LKRVNIVLLLLELILIPLAQGKPLPIKNFAVYYGQDKVKELEKFDLVIVSPLIENKTIELLKSKGVLVVGYVSISTVGNWEPWRKFVSEDMLIGTEELWNEAIVNVNDERWHRVVLEEIIPYLVLRGFSGVFFDNLDIVDDYPDFKHGIIKIIKEVKRQYKGFIIVVNRGFSILYEIAPYIDALLFECFGTYYDFTTEKYRKWSGDNLEWILKISKNVKEFSNKYGFLVLALGYADPRDEKQFKEYMDYVNSLAKQFDFIPYVTDVYLKEINLKYAKSLFQDKGRIPYTYYLTISMLSILLVVLLFILKRALSKIS